MIGAAILWAGAGLQSTVDRVRDGDFLGALASAEAEVDPVRRAEGVLYVRHQAGDLDGALEAGVRGAAIAPGDEWLLDRTAYVALTLGRPGAARVSLDALRRALAADALASDAARASLAAYETNVVELERRISERDAALIRAHWTALLGAVGALTALAALAMPARLIDRHAPKGSRPSEAWTR
jgi:hypothetical protein